MGVLQISVSDQAVNLLRTIPPPELEMLKRQMTTWLEAELRIRQQHKLSEIKAVAEAPGKTAFTLADFQEAMEMTDEDMVLTFGEEYLLANNWHAHED